MVAKLRQLVDFLEKQFQIQIAGKNTNTGKSDIQY
jgi:hypothetical protein